MDTPTQEVGDSWEEARQAQVAEAVLATLEPIEEDFPDFDEGQLPLDDVEL